LFGPMNSLIPTPPIVGRNERSVVTAKFGFEEWAVD
jgi:hypothetical protein